MQMHPPLLAPDNARQPQRRRSRRAVFLTWLRKIHLYVGLWGALLGLLFGASGIMMNHRAILKLPVEKTVQRTVQMPLPDQGFRTPQALRDWLRAALKFEPVAPAVIKVQPSGPVQWGERPVWQPERWTINLNRPQGAVNAEYFVGNRFVKLDLVDATPVGTLMRLHQSVGVSAFWVVLADTIAGSLILLSVTGLLLWTQLHTVRTGALLTAAGALLYALCFFWSA